MSLCNVIIDFSRSLAGGEKRIKELFIKLMELLEEVGVCAYPPQVFILPVHAKFSVKPCETMTAWRALRRIEEMGRASGYTPLIQCILHVIKSRVRPEVRVIILVISDLVQSSVEGAERVPPYLEERIGEILNKAERVDLILIKVPVQSIAGLGSREFFYEMLRDHLLSRLVNEEGAERIPADTLDSLRPLISGGEDVEGCVSLTGKLRICVKGVNNVYFKQGKFDETLDFVRRVVLRENNG